MNIYVSGRYSAADHEGIEENILEAKKFAVDIWNAGHAAFCPHLNTQHFERLCKVSHEKYLDFDMKMLLICDAIFMVPGWEDSKGANAELARAKEIGLPIYYDISEIPPSTYGDDNGLNELLRWYDEFWALCRQRIVTGALKYGDDWKTKDNTLEVFFELMDIPNYKALQYAQEKFKANNIQ